MGIEPSRPRAAVPRSAPRRSSGGSRSCSLSSPLTWVQSGCGRRASRRFPRA